jgi:hypothetical protein
VTQVPTITSEMDHLDQLGAKAFDGFLVRKDLVRKYSRQYPVPPYVVEFLLGRYCASTDPAEIEVGLPLAGPRPLPVLALFCPRASRQSSVSKSFPCSWRKRNRARARSCTSTRSAS